MIISKCSFLVYFAISSQKTRTTNGLFGNADPSPRSKEKTASSKNPIVDVAGSTSSKDGDKNTENSGSKTMTLGDKGRIDGSSGTAAGVDPAAVSQTGAISDANSAATTAFDALTAPGIRDTSKY
jgi:hypothetical protein